MAKKKQVAVDNAVQSIISGSQSSKPTNENSEEKTKAIATRLEFETVDRLEAIAAEMGVKRAVVLRLAILKFIKAWDDGDRPSKTKKVIEVWDVE